MSAEVPKRMTAAVLYGQDDVRIEEVDIPKPGYQEVLCRIRAVSICGTDPGIISGKFKGLWPPHYPFIAGHEWTGEIVALGPSVIGFKVGDRVAAEAHKGCGICRRCLNGRYNICLNYGNLESGHRHYGFTVNGGYAQYCVISVKSIHYLPPSISFNHGTLTDTAATALYGINRCRLQVGESVVVNGPGPIGLLALQLAKAMGAGKVIVTGHRGARLNLAKKLGADEIIEVPDVDPVKKVKELTSSLGIDIVLECSGSVEAIKQSIDMLARGGRMAVIGFSNRAEISTVFDRLLLDDLEIHGIRAAPNTCDSFIELAATGKVDLAPIITHTFPLTEFYKALETFIKRIDGAIKVVLNP